jgi:hypothetical protein
MTHSVQTSIFSHSRLYNKRYYSGNLYQVVVNTEEGESLEYEIEADNFAKATEQAEEMVYSLGFTDVTYIEVYLAA